ncbi:Stp1/IreP family PP2C-type Ser/Thr phosphatase [Sporolactobacillus vineae]|uniref:Stp1/IreP family PP2C-type Ser/Thr phosphatase n=1 Tax=Sporolactobacillus vineae TaxID=444463 RepID=UPI0002896C8C|nr:Stp1/IreP family PP2C-type Ser/Thr phosphatase [Sporolactobacillus vineae]
MEAVFATDTGKVRTNNEDSVRIFRSRTQLLGIVADGMGGHVAGEVASRLAAAVAEQKWKALKEDFSRAEAVAWMNQLVRSMNVRIYDYAEQHAECRGMGTTVAAVFCGKDYVVVSTVGDSRVYLWQSGNQMKQVTEDHTLVNELVKTGQISRADAEVHPERHILMRALGTQPAIELDTTTLDWPQDSKILICSDGLTNRLPDERIGELLGGDQLLKDRAEAMVREANEAGGEDNISLIIIDHGKGGDQ